ncbi:hypothetical protein Sjap_014848 [Stephania japonica]|uniref:Uncharacterized protein n=1 Tax=Stephania japonica TaxID=461633 RepID=A0AAP0NTF5_9MAGN
MESARRKRAERETKEEKPLVFSTNTSTTTSYLYQPFHQISRTSPPDLHLFYIEDGDDYEGY